MKGNERKTRMDGGRGLIGKALRISSIWSTM